MVMKNNIRKDILTVGAMSMPKNVNMFFTLSSFERKTVEE